MASREAHLMLKAKQESDMTALIIAGKHVHDRNIDKLFERPHTDPSLLKALETTAWLDLERIHILYPHFPSAEFEEIMDTVSEKLTKSDNIANALIDKAQSFLQDSKNDLALRSYNLALVFSTPGSPVIGKIENFFLTSNMNSENVPSAKVEENCHQNVLPIRSNAERDENLEAGDEKPKVRDNLEGGDEKPKVLDENLEGDYRIPEIRDENLEREDKMPEIRGETVEGGAEIPKVDGNLEGGAEKPKVRDENLEDGVEKPKVCDENSEGGDEKPKVRPENLEGRAEKPKVRDENLEREDKMPEIPGETVEGGDEIPKVDENLEGGAEKPKVRDENLQGDHEKPKVRDENLEAEIREYRDEQIFKVKGNMNERIPSAADYVRMVDDTLKGRHLIVTEDVPAGTTVIVEVPYTSVLSDTATWETKHCAKCFRIISRGIPCEGCVFALYCSEACRTKDYNEGHKYECGCMPYVHVMRLSPSFHLGLKALCKAGPSTLFDHFKASKESDSEDDESQNYIRGFDPKTGRYDSDSYYQILFLAKHGDKCTFDAMCMASISVAWILNSKTSFFDDTAVDSSEKSEFIAYIAYAYLQHSLSFRYNAFGMMADQKSEMAKTRDLNPKSTMNDEHPVVTSIFSICSCMNHSCQPTAIRENLCDGTMAVITVRSLIPGEELTIGYGFHFMTHQLVRRQLDIMEGYRFYCDCVACSNKWPELREKYPISYQLCTACSVELKHDEIEKYDDCTMGKVSFPGVFLCDRCGSHRVEEDLNDERKTFGAAMRKAYKYIKNDQPLKAIKILPSCVEYYQKNYSPPSLQLFRAQFLFQSACVLIVHRESSEEVKSTYFKH